MQQTRIIEDRVSRQYFCELLDSYPAASRYELKARNYLTPAEPELHDGESFLTLANDAADQVVNNRAQNVFVNYEEFTSGSTGRPKQCLRPSISWHLEFKRLRDLLDNVIQNKDLSSPWPTRLFYYSRYGRSTFNYKNTGIPTIHVEKFVYDNVEDLFQKLEDTVEPFILSGSPSSIVDLIDLGVDQFTPTITLISGERCPVHIFDQIERISEAVANMLVAREFGLIGFQCKVSNLYHFFSNCLEISRNKNAELVVKDPSNYLNPSPIVTEDKIGPLEHGICACGFEGLSTAHFEGRPYNKGYPAL